MVYSLVYNCTLYLYNLTDLGYRSFDRVPMVMDVSEFPEIGQRGRVVRLQSKRILVRPFCLVQLVVDMKYGSQVAVTSRVLPEKNILNDLIYVSFVSLMGITNSKIITRALNLI